MTKLPEDWQQIIKKGAGLGGLDVTTEDVLSDIDNFDSDESIKGMMQNVKDYLRMLREQITFIDPDLSAMVPFTRENLYLLCATSGTGKSTTAANISYPLWKQNKKVLIISNEESGCDVLYRIACLELGYNFNDYKKNRMPNARVREVALKFKEIAGYVKVLDVAWKNGLTSTPEGVKLILEAAKERDFSCVLIDYWQNIKRSTSGDQSGHYNILDDLRIYLGQYIKSSHIPIVLFAQIYPATGKRSPTLEDRIKMGKTVYETATVAIEIITDFATSSSKFLIDKDRFGYKGKYLNCIFDTGRYKSATEQEYQDHLNQLKMGDIAAMVDPGDEDEYNEPEKDEDGQ